MPGAKVNLLYDFALDLRELVPFVQNLRVPYYTFVDFNWNDNNFPDTVGPHLPRLLLRHLDPSTSQPRFQYLLTATENVRFTANRLANPPC
jgi:hypothetical protein